jgi:hypothetical protein
MPGEVTKQSSTLALPSPLRETNKSAERNGCGEVTEKLQVVTSLNKRRSKKCQAIVAINSWLFSSFLFFSFFFSFFALDGH